MTRKPPRILSIAGSDSGGGAGIQADIRTISRLGGHAMTAITAVTAQNSAGGRAIDVMTPEMVADQIWAVADDLGIDAIKIGMLGSADNAAEVAGILSILPKVPVVFDPVMVASSGAELADDRTIAIFRRIIPLATLVTPNLPELERLGGEDALKAMGTPFLVKGGHGVGNTLIDRLIGPKRRLAHWQAERIDTRHTHGTGCTLSAAIATNLAMGDSLKDAIGKARDYVRASLEAAPGYGSGSGPMGMPEL